MSLEITVTTESSNSKRVSIAGSLDSNTAQELQHSVDAEIGDAIATVIFDLKELDFLSSAGLRVIFKTRKMMDNNGGRFLLVNLQPQIKKVFEIIKALDGMNVFKNQEEMDSYLAAMQNKVKDGE